MSYALISLATSSLSLVFLFFLVPSSSFNDSIDENGDSLTVSVAGDQAQNDLTVSYTMAGTATPGTDYTISGGT